MFVMFVSKSAKLVAANAASTRWTTANAAPRLAESVPTNVEGWAAEVPFGHVFNREN
jgi:hypothetical protein